VETGPRYRRTESFNYSCSSLLKQFKKFRNKPEVAYRLGRCDGYQADQVTIANIAYSDKMGNGDEESGDGWLYRGAGDMGLTFYDNYLGYAQYLYDDFRDIFEKFDGEQILMRGADFVSGREHTTLSGFVYWEKEGVYLASRKGLTKEASDLATDTINYYTDSRPERWKQVQRAGKLIRGS